MIKKIDANKYGVVRYAISSIEDIADLPREVSVGSEAILVNEDGEKKFRLGSDGWVEVVEVKEYDEDKLRDMLEDAKVGYGGIEYETLEERLEKDFDNAYSVLDNRTYVEYEGCRITAKDSLNGLQKETVVKGRTLQNLVSMAKLYSDNDAFDGSAFKNQVFATKKVSWDYNLTARNDILKLGSTYTVIINYNKGDYTGTASLRYSSSGKLKPDGTINFNESKRYVYAVTIDEERMSHTAFLHFKGSNPAEHSGYFSFTLMVLEGDYTETPLEELPFIGGIESVGDKSKNLFDGKTRNGYYSSGEFKVNSSNLANVNPIEIKPNTYYTGSGDSLPRMSFYDSDMNFISYNPNLTTCLSPSNAKYMNIHAFGATYFQIEEGSRATSYEPHYDGYKISGKSYGKNLFKGEYGACNMNTTGNIVETDTEYVTNTNGNGLGISFSFDCKPNTDYSFNCRVIEVQGTPINYRVWNKTTKSYITSDFNKTFNTGNKVKLGDEVCIWVCQSGSGSSFYKIDKHSIQIEEGSKLSPYQPYKETTYSYILGEPLRSLPNGVCDEIDLEKGVLTRRVGKVVLDGSENWSITRTNSLSTIFGIAFKSNNDTKDVICDTFNGTFIPIFSDGDEAVKLNNTTIFISILNNKLSTVDANGFKQWLQANPTTVYYELVTPITEYLIKDDKFVTLPNGVKDEAGRIVTRNVGKIVFDGSEEWMHGGIGSGGDDSTLYAIHDFPAKTITDNNSIECICDTLPVYTANDSWKYTGQETICSLNVLKTFHIRIHKSKLSEDTPTGFKKWLSQNPITLYYQVETPYMECSYEKYPILPNGVKDEISHNSVLRKVRKIVLDGSVQIDSFMLVKGDTIGFTIIPNIRFKKVSLDTAPNIVNNIGFTISSHNAFSNNDTECISLTSDRYEGYNIYVRVSVSKLTSPDVNGFREWLTLNPITIWYESETTYTESINLDEVILNTTHLKSYEPITHITSDNYLPPTIKTQVPSDFNAVVLGLKNNNEALTSQVMSLRQTNDELEATNREQDDVIDVTLLALDEVYGMIDEGEIEAMSIGSPMVNVYVKMIKRGIKTLDEVPTKYRAEVEKLI